MAFILRRPFAVSSQALKQFSKPSSIIRSFHSSPLKPSPNQFASKRAASASTSSLQSRFTSFRDAFRRTYAQQSYAPTGSGNLTQRLLMGGALVGGTILAANLIFNRETREDGGMPLFERDYLNQTFMHTGLGIGVIALAATTMHRAGWSYRLMSFNPWVVIGVSLVASIGSMYATFNTSPDK